MERLGELTDYMTTTGVNNNIRVLVQNEKMLRQLDTIIPAVQKAAEDTRRLIMEDLE